MRRVEEDDYVVIEGVTPDMTAEEALEVIAEQVGARVELPARPSPDSVGAVDAGTLP